MSTELERIEVPLISRPMITPDDAAGMARELRQMIAKVLVKDKHYQAIRGRDVLLKAGAEELQKVFGLSFTYSELATWTSDEGVFSASVKCSVSNSNARVLSESYGLYDSSERKGANANTVVKMAQKRAYVSAIMAATGTSELFTVDLEDVVVEPDPSPPSTADERLILVELFARKGGKTIPEAERWLAGQEKRGEKRWVAAQVLHLLLREDPRPASPPLSEPVEGAGQGTAPSPTRGAEPGSNAPGVASRETPTSAEQIIIMEAEAMAVELPPDPPPVSVETGHNPDDDIPF